MERPEGHRHEQNIAAAQDKQVCLSDPSIAVSELSKAYRPIDGAEQDSEAKLNIEQRKDPEFYEFTRSMRAYDATFNNKSDVLLIDPKSDFFKYLNKSKGNN